MNKVAVFWFRRDLRLHDNCGLHAALSSGLPVLPIFIFDTAILDELPEFDRRVEFIHQSIESIHNELTARGSGMKVYHGGVIESWKKLLDEFDVGAVYCNHDYEPYANKRDAEVENLLRGRGVTLTTYKDQVLFEKTEILNQSAKPYTVFTPYSKAWKAKMAAHGVPKYPSQELLAHFLQHTSSVPSLTLLGFKETGFTAPTRTVPRAVIENYHEQRDIPSVQGTTRLSVHLRFGTISIRECISVAASRNETWLNELIWREFYMMILWNFPHVATSCFKPAYNAIEWRNNEQEFEMWCKGQTGIPIVDAGIRELTTTGFMHNRVRMITASFLVKHLLVDWRWGERYFALHLNDFDLSANNGGWQWCAGSGCDAAPYFRIFNPLSQTEKFDSRHVYIRTWVPEFGTSSYPAPIVDVSAARERCLQTYKKALAQ